MGRKEVKKAKSTSIISSGLQNAERIESLSTDYPLVTSCQLAPKRGRLQIYDGNEGRFAEYAGRNFLSFQENLHEVVVFVIFNQRQIPLFDIRLPSI